jgi:hypothetical protein
MIQINDRSCPICSVYGPPRKLRQMRFSRSTRSLVALFTAALLLLCHGASAAQACVALFAPAGVEHSVPCHGVEGNEAPSMPSAVSMCDASAAVADPVKAPPFSIADLPLLTVLAVSHVSAPLGSIADTGVHAVCSSPPLTILHCRFVI